jgi:hypothetical protein
LWLLITLAGLGLAGYTYLGNFTRLMADDFCSIYLAEQLGLFRSTWYWYLNWSGRYTAFALDWVILKFALGPYYLHYIVPFSILAWMVCIVTALHFALGKMNEWVFLHALALAGVFLLAVFNLSPNLPQSLFWWNGMRSYGLPLVVLSAYIPLYQMFMERSYIHRVWKCSLGFVLLFITGGMGETMAVAQTAFMLFWVGLYILKLLEKRADELWVLGSSLAGAVAAMIVVILSPGNAVRQAYLPPSPDLNTLLIISLQAYGSFIGKVLFQPLQLATLSGALLAAVWIGGQYHGQIPDRPYLIPAIVLGSVAVSFACFPPGVYGYSEPPPSRAIIIPLFFLIAGLLWAAFLSGVRLAERYSSEATLSTVLASLTLVLIGFAVVITLQRLYQERPMYSSFAETWDRVDTEIKQARLKGAESITIPAMDSWAGLDRPNPNPRFWATQCYSDYYGIQIYGPPY